jgi:hypothetical protein
MSAEIIPLGLNAGTHCAAVAQAERPSVETARLMLRAALKSWTMGSFEERPRWRNTPETASR